MSEPNISNRKAKNKLYWQMRRQQTKEARKKRNPYDFDVVEMQKAIDRNRALGLFAPGIGEPGFSPNQMYSGKFKNMPKFKKFDVVKEDPLTDLKKLEEYEAIKGLNIQSEKTHLQIPQPFKEKYHTSVENGFRGDFLLRRGIVQSMAKPYIEYLQTKLQVDPILYQSLVCNAFVTQVMACCDKTMLNRELDLKAVRRIDFMLPTFNGEICRSVGHFNCEYGRFIVKFPMTTILSEMYINSDEKRLSESQFHIPWKKYKKFFLVPPSEHDKVRKYVWEQFCKHHYVDLCGAKAHPVPIHKLAACMQEAEVKRQAAKYVEYLAVFGLKPMQTEELSIQDDLHQLMDEYSKPNKNQSTSISLQTIDTYVVFLADFQVKIVAELFIELVEKAKSDLQPILLQYFDCERFSTSPQGKACQLVKREGNVITSPVILTKVDTLMGAVFNYCEEFRLEGDFFGVNHEEVGLMRNKIITDGVKIKYSL